MTVKFSPFAFVVGREGLEPSLSPLSGGRFTFKLPAGCCWLPREDSNSPYAESESAGLPLADRVTSDSLLRIKIPGGETYVQPPGRVVVLQRLPCHRSVHYRLATPPRIVPHALLVGVRPIQRPCSTIELLSLLLPSGETTRGATGWSRTSNEGTLRTQRRSCSPENHAHAVVLRV